MNTILSRLQQFPKQLLVVLVVGVLLRILFISFHQRPLISDEKEYDALAFKIASTATYEHNGSPTAYRPVGYPAFAGLVYAICGHRPIAVKFLQAFIDSATGLLLYFLLIGFPERVRIIGVSLWIFYIPAILYTNLLMTETVFVFLLTLSVLVLVKDQSNRDQRLVFLGLLFGIQILVKPGAAIFLLASPLLFVKFGFSPRKAILFAATLLVTLSPWLLRNYFTLGHFSLTSNGGVNLLIGNNPRSTGAYVISFDERILASSRDEFEADRTALHTAVAFIAENPGTFVLNAVKKLAHLCESEGGLLVWSFHNNPEDSTTRFASKYASIPPVLSLLTNLPYFALLLTGLFGFLAAKKDDLWWTVGLLLGCWLLLHATFFGGGRFHFPAMSLLVPFSAIFLGGVQNALRGFSWSQWTVVTLASALLVTLWIYEGIAIHNV